MRRAETKTVARISLAFGLAASAGLAAGTAQAGGCYGGSACYRQVVHPPVYDVVSDPVLVSPPRTIYRTVPAVFETVSERVLVRPAGRVWQTRPGPYGELIGCWVEVPPQYDVRTRRVMVRPPEVVPVTVPPAYGTVSRRVLVAPARAGWEPLGPGYGPVSGPYGAGSIPDAFGITGASSADVGVGLGFSRGSIYDGY